jgi:tRNA pseudouridine55 synthase
VLPLTAEQAGDLGNGKRIAVAAADSPMVAAVSPNGALVGMASVQDGVARTIVNFPADSEGAQG